MNSLAPYFTTCGSESPATSPLTARPKHLQRNQDVVHVWWTTATLICGENRRRRIRIGDDHGHGQSVHFHTGPSNYPTVNNGSLMSSQSKRIMYEEMRTHRLPRKRSEQGRVRMLGPMRGQILRCHHEGQRQISERTADGRWPGHAWNVSD